MTPRNQGRLAFLDGMTWQSFKYAQEVRCFQGRLLGEDGTVLVDMTLDQDVDTVWHDFKKGISEL